MHACVYIIYIMYVYIICNIHILLYRTLRFMRSPRAYRVVVPWNSSDKSIWLGPKKGSSPKHLFQKQQQQQQKKSYNEF